MSYEAWGDDDDGLDEVLFNYRKQLLEEGWFDEEQVAALQKELQRYRFWRAHPRSYFVVNVDENGVVTLGLHPVPVEAWDKAYTGNNVDAAIDEALRLHSL